MDLCEKIVQRAEKEIGKKLNRKYYPVNPKTRIQLLANGTIDIECGSTTNNLTRQQQIDYAHVTFITGTKLLVKKSSGITSIDGMKGKKIALAQGTTNEKAVTKVNSDRGLGIKVVNVKDHAEGFLALETGRVDAYSTDHILLFGLISKAKKPADYAVVGKFLSYDPYAIMIRRDDSAMRLIANSELSDLFRSGEINKIYDKWFMNKLPEGGNALGVPQTDLLSAAFTMQALPY
jgi:glutamate/aspartate transport system substrate-binding protein